MKKSNLTFIELVKEMHRALRECEYLAQRDAILDIAELADRVMNNLPCNLYWAIHMDGSLLRHSNDFGIYNDVLYGRYYISFHPALNWSIERLPD